MNRRWQETSRIFADRAREYDQWYEDSLLFAIELEAVRHLLPLPRPSLEIGVGPGRFAQALGVDFGMDPALPPLRIASSRGIAPLAATGEEMPIKGRSLGTVIMLFTFCFLVDPAQALAECHRVLRSDGSLILGIIPAHSPWGKRLQKKKEQGHPFYAQALFHSAAQTATLLHQAGFEVDHVYSTLRQTPDTLRQHEHPYPELDEQAGFCVIKAQKRKQTP